MAPNARPVRGRLTGDDDRLQCHECGDWFVALDQHVYAGHGLTADQYREDWDLPAGTRLRTPGLLNTNRARALQRIDQAGKQDLPRFLPGTFTEDGEVGAAYDKKAQRLWQVRLKEAGWSSWQDVVDWALRNDKTWRDVADRLGRTHQQTRDVGMAHGAVIPPRWERMVAKAELHAAEHGTLLNVRGELSNWLVHLRNDGVSAQLPRRAIRRIDQLDPDWRLDRSARRAAAERRGIRTHREISAFERIQQRLTAAGFTDASDLIGWGITNHVGPTEVGASLGIRGDTLLSQLTTGNPVDPLAATRHLRTSVHGHLEDDGLRVQCHECGLWLASLGHHLRGHRDETGTPLTAASYRHRNGLPSTTKLSSRGGAERGQTAMWRQRLADSGFASWEALLIHAATHRRNLADLAEPMGISPQSLLSGLRHALPDDTWGATVDYRLSRPGHVEVDGDRSQCHECGLWFTRLGEHVSAHDDGTALKWTWTRTWTWTIVAATGSETESPTPERSTSSPRHGTPIIRTGPAPTPIQPASRSSPDQPTHSGLESSYIMVPAVCSELLRHSQSHTAGPTYMFSPSRRGSGSATHSHRRRAT